MPRPSRFKIASLTFLAAGLVALASAATVTDEIPGADKRVSVDLRNTETADALRYFARKGGFNVSVSDAVTGRLSLYLKDVRIAEVLDIILQSQGLAYRRRDEVLYVMTRAEFRERFGQEYGEGRVTVPVKLRWADPQQAARVLDPLKSRVGSIVVDERSGMLIFSDSSEKVDELVRVLRRIDRPPVTRVYDLDYAKPADVRNLLLSQPGAKNTLTVSVDDRTNQIAVTASRARLREAERLIERADRRTREVAIDARIVQVLLTDAYRQGIDWRYLFRRGALESLEFNANLPQTLASFGSIGYGTVGNDNFEIVLNFLRGIGRSKILASPRLTVVERGEARILIGTREAYVTSTTTTAGSGVSTTAESVSFIDVGVSLRVSPVINKEGFVTMKVRPEVSSVTRTLTTPSESQIPIVDTTQAETRVMVKDGHTLVIGGLRKDEKTYSSNRVPWLSDLPVLGNLFRQHVDEVEQSELVVFLTPHVLDGDEDVASAPEAAGPFKGLRPYAASAGLPAGPEAVAAAPGGVPSTVLAPLELKGLEPYAGKG